LPFIVGSVGCCLPLSCVAARTPFIVEMQHISTEQGLPNRRAFDILQDHQGFIWISCTGAIYRYDGVHFKAYPASQLGIIDHKPPHIAVDVANHVWYVGLGRNDAFVAGMIDVQHDAVISAATLLGPRFQAQDWVYCDNPEGDKDAIYAISHKGDVWRFTSTATHLFRIPHPQLHNFQSIVVQGPSLWISSSNVIYHLENGILKQTLPTTDMTTAMMVVGNDVVSEDYSSISGSDLHFRLTPNGSRPFSLQLASLGKLYGIRPLGPNVFLVSTDQGLTIQDSLGQACYTLEAIGRAGVLPIVHFYGDMKDRQGAFWVTTDEGLFKITLCPNPFELYHAGNSSRAIYEMDSMLWMGGYSGNHAHHLPTGNEIPFLSEGEVAMSAFRDQAGLLWFGSGSGSVYSYHPPTRQYQRHFLSPEHAFFLVYQNPQTGNYFLGSDQGLVRFDPQTDRIAAVNLGTTSNHIEVRQLLQSSSDLWVVTNEGLFQLDATTEQLMHHFTQSDGLPTENLNFMHIDGQGMVWISTRDAGLVRWDLSTQQFRVFTTANGLSDNTIYAVYEDEFRTLWLPSNYGLMAFDKSTGSCKRYLPADGIAHEEFNTFSHFQVADGKLFFGGLNGITAFYPQQLRGMGQNTTPVFATQVRVLEHDSETYTDLTPAVLAGKTLSLDPAIRLLEVNLSTLDFNLNEHAQFAYQISPLDDRWTYLQGAQLVLHHLPYGEYELRVAGRNAAGQWSERLLKLAFVVNRPFYLQWPFIVGMMVLALAIVVAVFRLRVRHLERVRQRLEAEVTKRTQQIEADKEIIAAQAEGLKELDKAKSRFFANVTHELRTPLTLVLGPAEQLLAAPELPPSLKPKLLGIHTNAAHLLLHINQLLDLAKVEHHAMRLDLALGDWGQHTAAQVERLQPMAEQKGICLRFHAPSAPQLLPFDADKWEKIIFNLVSNALKFTPQGGYVDVTMAVVPAAAPAQIVLIVSDTGIGIAANDHSHIFDRFFQVDDSMLRQQQGTGLGLALVKELVELLDGKIEVASAPNEGTCFTLTLPIVAWAPTLTAVDMPLPNTSLAALEFSAHPTHPENGNGTSHEHYAENDLDLEDSLGHEAQPHDGKLQVLVIEDNAELLAFIQSCLDATRYTVHAAYDGIEGIQKAQELVPDLIVSDVMMPGKDGFEVVKTLRAHVATSHIPIILLTAKASFESRMEGLRRGADAYMTKPFSPAELVLHIDQLIALRQMLRARYSQAHLAETKEALFVEEDRFILQLRAYVQANLTEPDLNGDRIGDHFAMSRMQLHRKLRALANTSISDFVRLQRLAAAQQLLAKGELNVSEVAYETGFTSPSHFSRVFKQEFGKAPSELR
jgi:signal transduction histidine kinase/AraC-like DNA-binding protein